MKRFGLILGLAGVLLLMAVGRMNRPASIPDRVGQPASAPEFAGHPGF